MGNVLSKKADVTLSVRDLADALYGGTPHLRDLAAKLAVQHAQAGPLVVFELMPEDVQNFWCWVAQMLIDHSAEWRVTQAGLELSQEESDRLAALPRHPELDLCKGQPPGDPSAGAEIDNSKFEIMKDGFNVCGRCNRIHPKGQADCNF